MIREEVRDITLSIRKISEKASEKEDCIRLDIGQPSFDTPGHVKEAAGKKLDQKQGYTSTVGIESLREAISEEENSNKGIEVSIDNVMVTVGGMQALYALFATRLDQDSTVALNDPCWGPYKLISGINGNGFEQVQFWDKNGDLRPEARETIGSADAVVVNTPSNPAGRVLEESQAREIAEVAEDSGTFLISDEVYHRLRYGSEHASPAAFAENSAIIGSVSKNHAMTGWRIGWVVGDEGNLEEYAKATRAMTASPPKISQVAAENALRADSHVEQMRETYRERRDLAVERMRELGWNFIDPEGAIYTFPEIGEDSWSYCLEMIEEGVAMVPGEPFGSGSDENIRICFGAVEKPELEKAFDRIEDSR